MDSRLCLSMWMTTAGSILQSQTIPYPTTFTETGTTERSRTLAWHPDLRWPTTDMPRLPWESVWAISIATEELIFTLLLSPTITMRSTVTRAMAISPTWLTGRDWELLLFPSWRGRQGFSI